MPEIRSETSLLVAFVDLTRFASQSQRVGDVELADGIDAYYEQVGASVEGAGGRVVKFVGDGVLVVFAEDQVDRGVEVLLALKEAVDLSRELAGDGMKVQVRRASSASAAAPAPTPTPAAGGETWHRVRVGAFPDRAEAVTVLKELEAKGYKPFLARGAQ